MADFITFVFTPSGHREVSLAIAGSRAGGIGVLDAELEPRLDAVVEDLERVASHARGPFGLRLGAITDGTADALRPFVRSGLAWLIVDLDAVQEAAAFIGEMRDAGVRVLAEARAYRRLDAGHEDRLDGLLLKGNESGGYVGEDSSFILLQRWLGRTRLPLYVRGGLTPHMAAACSAVGVAGGVLDAQLLSMPEARLHEGVRTLLQNLAGSETVAVGDGERGEYFRILVRPGHVGARAFVAEGQGFGFESLRPLVQARPRGWDDPVQGLLPIGQDVCFAAPWRTQFGHVAGVLQAIERAVTGHLRKAVELKPIFEAAPLAEALRLRFPIVQGPMTRVSDVAEFASAVADGGALPMVAFALLKGPALESLLAATKQLLGDRPWGIGLLGFAPQALLDEQLACASAYKPDYAIIAGGRPDQAVHLEAGGVPTFLHVPSANLIPLFIREGARRFIFEGRECGGHIGPLSSFVLWSTMVDRLLVEIPASKVPADRFELIFAGGIHDAVSSAMLQVMVSPLAAQGVKVGILMGSAYLFTREIVATGAVVPQFQQEAIDCERTVNLESGPGHASRCAFTPFAAEFFRTRLEHRSRKVPADDSRRALDDLILGRLRIASKGRSRRGADGPIESLDVQAQRDAGMYMLGQVATLRAGLTDIASLHREVTLDAAELLERRLHEPATAAPPLGAPVDIAIVGMGVALPKANSPEEYWANILDKVDAITEIPSHRWDWRLYYDADRTAKDKIYSRWGGFLDDMAFDPTRYGMPPKSIESVDPMQLMALEVARRTLEDAGYGERTFDRERASVIVGASGGTGDFGSQYGLRAELPRFSGALPAEVADRLPEWTEDSFAGILLNVIAGRIANRLNFGGVNFTTDAACASSLAAVYQGVTELTGGRSDLVIAGGVDTVQGPFGYLCFSKTQALSPRGRCSTFDESADGIVISEGIAMVALKRLADAERDGDRIYAVIKGVGGSSDGKAKGMTAPLPAGQLRAMRRAYQQAGFGPASVGVFEAHGTGTVAGDTAELQSTMQLIADDGGAAREAVIGSVKTMVGHTKATAGLAGLVKAALALHRQVLPPHRGVDRPLAILRAPDSRVYLVDEARPWVAPVRSPRRAAVSSFGFGGTNFHLVMEEYRGEYRDWQQPATTERWPAELLLWSDVDRTALARRLADLRSGLAAHADITLRDLAASLAQRWTAGAETVAIVAKDHADLLAKLGLALKWLEAPGKALPPGVYHGARTEGPGKVAFLFPGQGSQYPEMLRAVAAHFGVCRETLSDADAVLRERFETRFGAGARLSHFIFPRGSYDDADRARARDALTSTDVAQPALGAVEVALHRLVRSLGVRPDLLAGHSYGEFVALFAAGAIDFKSLMALSAARGGFIVDAAKAAGSELGTMAAVPAPRSVVEETIAGIEGVVVANHNAPLQSIVSGPHAGVAEAAARFAKAGIDVAPLPVAAAFHSSLVQPAQRSLAALIETIDWHPIEVPVFSNSTGGPHGADIAQLRSQMADHLVRPVEFAAEIEAMHADGARVFLEVGPKSVLSRLVTKILEARPHVAIALDDGTGLPGLLNGLAQLACAGIAIDVDRLFSGRSCRLGDPARLESLQRETAPSKHVWMLNGSSARRAADPVAQVGVRLDDVEARRDAVAANDRAAQSVAASQTDPSTASPAPALPQSGPGTASLHAATTAPRWNKEREMEPRRRPEAADPIMAEYFETMRQFLTTQERIMSAYLGDAVPRVASLPRGLRSSPPLTLSHHANRIATTDGATAVRQEQPQATAPAAAQDARAATAVPTAREPAPHTHAINGANGANGVNGIHVPDTPNGVVVHAAANGANGAATINGKRASAGVDDPGAGDVGAASAIDRQQLTDMLLTIVEDKTGYPRDMLGLDQGLESDLGIDSIKRIEVVGAMLQALPDRYREALGESRRALNTQQTLNGMLELLSALDSPGGAPRPFECAETGSTGQSLPSRHLIVAESEALDPAASKRLKPGHFLVTEDEVGLAPALVGALASRGCTVTVVPRAALADEERLALWTAAERANLSTVAGIVHAAPVAADWLPIDTALDAWRVQLLIQEKSLFLLLRGFADRLAPDAQLLAVSALGGSFGRLPGPARGLSLQGGAVGLLKSLREESPKWRTKAIDVDRSRGVDAIAADLLAELETSDGRQEIGFSAGVRTVFRSRPAATAPAESNDRDRLHDLVVLCTGGARGVTAEALRELALPGNVLVVTGRTELVAEDPATAACTDAQALRRHFVDAVRNGALRATPAEIDRNVRQVLALRELQRNLDDFASRGARVEYHAVDVTDDDAMARLIAGIAERHGPIGGVVHGAGIIEDRLLVDKTPESWSRVVDTKVLGLLALLRHLRPQALRFLTVFSSVAGRYGNRGQTDYATANELMNRVCCQLRDQWGDRVSVSALCWGPWGPTTFGAGMVTAETTAKFAAKGVALVDAAQGRRLFADAVGAAPGGPVEIVCGQGDWEAHEAAVAVESAVAATTIEAAPVAPADLGSMPAARAGTPTTVQTGLLGPLLGRASVMPLALGEQRITVVLDAAHAYLDQHRIDGVAVLPAAAATELMAEAARALWPGWKVSEVRDLRLIKGIEVKEVGRVLHMIVTAPPYGSSDGFDVSVAIRSDAGSGRSIVHYRCGLRLEQQLQDAFKLDLQRHDQLQLTVAKAYDELLFHGPCFQVIEAIDGVSDRGAAARVRSTRPSDWLAGPAADQREWIFDPALIDGAAQMALLWARTLHGHSCLPARFARIARLRETLPARLRMAFENVPSADPHLVGANVYFLDDADRVVMLIEGMECVGSAALNRLGGTAARAAPGVFA